jgi:hypothetical protein
MIEHAGERTCMWWQVLDMFGTLSSAENFSV